MNKPLLDIQELLVSPATSIREAAARMDKRHLGIIMIVDARGRLIGTVTDGDLRRALLARIKLETPIKVLLERKKGTPYAKPLSAPAAGGHKACLAVFKEHKIFHLPLLDARRRVVGLATRDDVLWEPDLPMRAVVMAGGKGTRLMPLTKDTPKPMLHVGDRPLMEIIIEQLKGAGIKKVKVATLHNREKITKHFGDGAAFGVDVSYLNEDRPLGTAGALGLMEKSDETMLVINGDVLTQVDFRAMLRYHREMGAALTAAVCQYDFKIPYGVVECEGPLVRRIDEKPTLEFFVCAGIYMLEPEAFRAIPKGRHMDMTDLIGRLVKRGRKVASFPIREYWLDIGKPDDYATAQRQAAAWGAAAKKP